MHLIVFEDKLTNNFYPLTLTKPVFDLTLGTRTLLDQILDDLRPTTYSLNVSPHLERTTSARHKVDVNPSNSDGEYLIINGLVKLDELPLRRLLRKKKFVAFSNDHLVISKMSADENLNLLLGSNLNSADLMRRLGDQVEKLVLHENVLFRYPWDLVGQNFDAISNQLSNRKRSSKSLNLPNNIVGSTDMFTMDDDVSIECGAVFDTRLGPIHISSATEVQAHTRISGPAYIGKGTLLKSALIGSGTTIGDFSKVSGEVEATILSKHSNKFHDGFLGDSYVGEWVNIGASTTTSNLKNTYGTIKIKVGGVKIDTKRIKVGAYLADNSKTAVGTYLYSGSRIGVGSHVHGYVLEDVPSFTMYAKSLGGSISEGYLESVIETQKRMMKRRNVKQTREDVQLLRKIFELTRCDRYSAGVLRKPFTLN